MKRQEYVRASEIGSYLFCKKAWEYRRRGVSPSADVQASRDAGVAFHRRHGTSVIRSRMLMFVGLLLVLLALFLFFFPKLLMR